jgi:hypothetical protein
MEADGTLCFRRIQVEAARAYGACYGRGHRREGSGASCKRETSLLQLRDEMSTLKDACQSIARNNCHTALSVPMSLK